MENISFSKSVMLHIGKIMFKSNDEILAELHETINQLLLNVQTAKEVSVTDLSETEIEALHKTQESLLARFSHMNELIKESDRKKWEDKNRYEVDQLDEKCKKFSLLNKTFIESICCSQAVRRKKPRIGKNRKR